MTVYEVRLCERSQRVRLMTDLCPSTGKRGSRRVSLMRTDVNLINYIFKILHLKTMCFLHILISKMEKIVMTYENQCISKSVSVIFVVWRGIHRRLWNGRREQQVLVLSVVSGSLRQDDLVAVRRWRGNRQQNAHFQSCSTADDLQK